MATEWGGPCREEGEDSEREGGCPMAGFCRGMMEKPKFGRFVLIPAVFFSLCGVLILFEPQALRWLLGGAALLLGLALFAAAFMLGRSRPGRDEKP